MVRFISTVLTRVLKSPWRYHRAFTEGSCLKIQLRQADLPQVLRSSPSSCHQLPQAGMWSLVSAPPVSAHVMQYCSRSLISTRPLPARRSSNSGMRPTQVLHGRFGRGTPSVWRGAFAHVLLDMHQMICIHAEHVTCAFVLV